MTQRKIEVGKRYMLIHGYNEGPDYCRTPTAYDIDLLQPVTVIRKYRIHYDGERRWKIVYTRIDGSKFKGFASDRSFGKEV